LLEELEKEKIGNPKDIAEIKQILVKEKKLDEADIKYLTKLDVRLQKKHDLPIVTTTESIQGKEIDGYLGVVSGHAVMGMVF